MSRTFWVVWWFCFSQVRLTFVWWQILIFTFNPLKSGSQRQMASTEPVSVWSTQQLPDIINIYRIHAIWCHSWRNWHARVKTSAPSCKPLGAFNHSWKLHGAVVPSTRPAHRCWVSVSNSNPCGTHKKSAHKNTDGHKPAAVESGIWCSSGADTLSAYQPHWFNEEALERIHSI